MNALLDAVQPATQTGMSAATTLTWAVVLLLLGAALAITEFLVVSWGMLLVGAVVSWIAAIALAFQVSQAAGWIFVVITPALAVVVVRAGIALMRRNRSAVVAEEITADAGYRHAANAAGIAAGTIGELVTPATPSGRARFPGRAGPVELDVRVQGQTLERGERVVVLAIDGPTVTVAPARDNVSGLMNTNPTDKV